MTDDEYRTKLRELVPQELDNEFVDEYPIADIFKTCLLKAESREQALIYCVKYLLGQRKLLVKDNEALYAVRSALWVTTVSDYYPKLSMLRQLAGVEDK